MEKEERKEREIESDKERIKERNIEKEDEEEEGYNRKGWGYAPVWYGGGVELLAFSSPHFY